MTTKSKAKWFWYCYGGDERHGCWHADYDGRCGAKSRKAFATKKAAETAGSKHRCRFSNGAIGVDRG